MCKYLIKEMESEEEINGKITVVEFLVNRACRETFEDVVPDYHKGCDASESVEKFVSRLCGESCFLFFHSLTKIRNICFN